MAFWTIFAKDELEVSKIHRVTSELVLEAYFNTAEGIKVLPD